MLDIEIVLGTGVLLRLAMVTAYNQSLHSCGVEVSGMVNCDMTVT